MKRHHGIISNAGHLPTLPVTSTGADGSWLIVYLDKPGFPIRILQRLIAVGMLPHSLTAPVVIRKVLI